MILALWPFGPTIAQRVQQWLGISIEYAAAVGLVVLGGYLIFQFTLNPMSAWAPFTKPLRAIGFLLIGAGIIVGSVTYGKQSGASRCEANWRAANLQAQIDRAKQETEVQRQAAATAQEQSAALEKERQTLEEQVKEYDKYLQGVVAEQSRNAVAGCELTADDVRQLRSITGAIPTRRKGAK